MFHLFDIELCFLFLKYAAFLPLLILPIYYRTLFISLSPNYEIKYHYLCHSFLSLSSASFPRVFISFPNFLLGQLHALLGLSGINA